MFAAQAKSGASLAALRATIFQQAHDPLVAQRVYDVAVAARSVPTRAALPWLTPTPVAQGEQPQAPPHPAVAHAAHDICVVAAFVGPDQADKAHATLGPADWRLVTRLGGWRALHEVAPHFRRRHLHRHLAALLRCSRTGRWVRVAEPLRAANRPQAAALIATARRSWPSLAVLDEYDLLAREVSLGALVFLLDRMGPASDGWPLQRVRDGWVRVLARCPLAVEPAPGG